MKFRFLKNLAESRQEWQRKQPESERQEFSFVGITIVEYQIRK